MVEVVSVGVLTVVAVLVADLVEVPMEALVELVVLVYPVLLLIMIV